MRSSLVVCLVLASAATSLAAQTAPAPPPAHAVRDTTRWRFARAIEPQVGGQWGVGLGVQFGLQKPDGAGPSAVTGAFGADLRYGSTGSRSASLILLAPALHRDWRVLALVRTERMMRTSYFGAWNEDRQSDSLKQLYGTLYYRYALLRTTGFATIQRRITGPVWLHVGGQARYYRTNALKQSPSLYGQDFGAATGSDTARWMGLEGRAGLLLDTRDDWVASRRGVLLEAIAVAGRLTRQSDDSVLPYRRVLLSAREFMSLDDSARTVLALRQRLSMARDTLPYFLAWEQITSWAPDDGLMNARTIRLHGGGNQLASNSLVLTAELRRILLDSSEEPKKPEGLWGIAFGDGALLWEPHTGASLRRTVWTLGVGLRLQTGRHSLVGLDVGWGDTGPNLNVTSSFGF